MKKKKNQNQTVQLEEKEYDVTVLKLSDIEKGYNPRKYFNENDLSELAENITKIGVIQPITVKKEGEKFRLVCGERRYRASILAGKETIPAIIRDITDDEAIDIAYFENIVRKDISPIEEAEAIKFLIDNKKETFKSLALRLGKSEVYLRTRYNLNYLISEIQELIDRDILQIGIGMLLASYDVSLQERIYNKHLCESASYNSYMYWGNLKYKDFAEKIKGYSLSLKDANFDTAECQNCPFNSAMTELFGEDNARCLKASCFDEKTSSYLMDKIQAVIGQNPQFRLFKSNSVSNWILEALQEEGYHVEDSYIYELYPDTPEEPNREDYVLEDEDEPFDQEGYDDALEEYQNELQTYDEEMQDIKINIENGTYIACYVLLDKDIVKGYYNPEDEQQDQEQDESQEQEADGDTQNAKEDDSLKEMKKQLKELSQKDKRNKEIQIENTVKDLKELFSQEIERTEKEDLEENLFYTFLIAESNACYKKFADGSCEHRKIFEAVQTISDSDKIFIMREYIKKNLNSYAFSAYSFASDKLIEFMMLHFPQQTEQISKKYNDVYEKRKKSLDERILPLESYIADKEKKDE